MRTKIYVEGGSSDNGVNVAVRQGFQKLFEKAGLKGRMPEFVPCGNGESAHENFSLALRQRKAIFVGLLVDSEEPVADLDKPWDHLEQRKENRLQRPEGATDEQAFLMASCMETWIAADHETLKGHYKGGCLQENALPSLVDLEKQHRHEVFAKLRHATHRCANAYDKGKPSFEILGKIEPNRIRPHLPSFARVERILNEKL